ncbi:MAG: hypothetical protein ACT4OX_04915 [Actinomycetota bacterium]
MVISRTESVRDMTENRDRPPAPDEPWFRALARFLGPAYLRNAFTMGTAQEVAFLVGTLGLEPGMRVLDAGWTRAARARACGARH